MDSHLPTLTKKVVITNTVSYAMLGPYLLAGHVYGTPLIWGFYRLTEHYALGRFLYRQSPCNSLGHPLTRDADPEKPIQAPFQPVDLPPLEWAHIESYEKGAVLLPAFPLAYLGQ